MKRPESADRRVVVVRDPPRDRRVSMERYADNVELALHGSEQWTSVSVTSNRAPKNWVSRQLDNLVGFPFEAGRHHGSVFHVVDHGYAHVARFLPYDRTVVTCHDLMPIRSAMGGVGRPNDAKTVLRFRWTVSHLRSVARVICVSDATASDVVHLANVHPDRIEVIPNSVDGSFAPCDDSRRRALRQGLGVDTQFVIANVSTGSPYKNPEAVLRTLAEVRNAGIDAVVVRTGRPFDSEIEHLKDQLGLRPFVIERGFVPAETLAETYKLSDVLLHPSYWEGFGWPPLEAMASGLPVVTSTAPALLEVVGSAGLSAPATEYGQLADEVRRLTDPQFAKKQSDLGVARAARFAESTISGKLLDLYERVAASASGGTTQ